MTQTKGSSACGPAWFEPNWEDPLPVEATVVRDSLGASSTTQLITVSTTFVSTMTRDVAKASWCLDQELIVSKFTQFTVRESSSNGVQLVLATEFVRASKNIIKVPGVDDERRLFPGDIELVCLNRHAPGEISHCHPHERRCSVAWR